MHTYSKNFRHFQIFVPYFSIFKCIMPQVTSFQYVFLFIKYVFQKQKQSNLGQRWRKYFIFISRNCAFQVFVQNKFITSTNKFIISSSVEQFYDIMCSIYIHTSDLLSDTFLNHISTYFSVVMQHCFHKVLNNFLKFFTFLQHTLMQFDRSKMVVAFCNL